MLITSRRCCTRRPEGPAAVSLGKDHKITIMLKSGSNETGVVWTTGGTCTGVGQLGCLNFNSCHVVSLLGAIPLDYRMRQAFPHIPDPPSDTAWSITLVRWLVDVLQAPLLWFVIRFLAISQRSPNLLSNHMLHRISTGRGLSWRPLRLRDGRTHFGSIKSLTHASSVFSRMTHLKADDKAHAKAGLDFDGTKRRVG